MISRSVVRLLKYRGVKNRPKTMKMTLLQAARKIPLEATSPTALKSFRPKFIANSALIPTPVPVEMAIIRFWMGKEIETAVRAFSLIRATKTLSTTLYRAVTSMDTIMGTDMVIMSRFTGITPILFSCCIVV